MLRPHLRTSCLCSRVDGRVRRAVDLPVTNFSSGWPSYAARENGRTFCCVSAAEVVVIAGAIILAIAMLSAAVFVARKIHRRPTSTPSRCKQRPRVPRQSFLISEFDELTKNTSFTDVVSTTSWLGK